MNNEKIIVLYKRLSRENELSFKEIIGLVEDRKVKNMVSMMESM